jgi:SAM-dependent methyltransferase
MTDTDSYRSRLRDEQRARDYATRFERGPRRRIDRREQQAVRRIFSRLTDCRTELDVPCGAGRFLANLAKEGRGVVEMDAAVEVLEFARQRAERLGVCARFIPGDAARMPIADEGVDAVFCNRLLHHIAVAEERAVFLREFHRVCRRWVVVSFFDYLAFGRLRRWLKALKGRRVDYSGQPTVAQFGEEVARAGFRVCELVLTGPPWVSQKYFVLEKYRPDPAVATATVTVQDSRAHPAPPSGHQAA